MTALAQDRTRCRVVVGGAPLAFTLTADGSNCWVVEHDGRTLGLVYRLAPHGGALPWRARPRGLPAPAIGYATRAKAVAALYEAMR